MNKPSRLFALFCLTLSVSVCSDDDDPTPISAAAATVTIGGSHGLVVGDAVTLTAATVAGADSAYQWSSERNDVATVDGAGMVTAVAPGETTITARGVDSGAEGEHVIVVSPTVDGIIVVSVMGTPFVRTGETVTLSAATNGAEDSGYTWASSAPEIAAVDAAGVVTGLRPGETTITATGVDSTESGALLVRVDNELPNYEAWLGSAHANYDGDAFNHWNEDDPQEIPTSCARCHSTPGYLDYLGADGSDPKAVDTPHPTGTVVECGACHNQAASNLQEVTFPSGETVDRLGSSSACMVCHQGRSSGDDVDEAIAAAAVTGDDQVSQNLNFLNIHYYAAAATLQAGKVRGGYQYGDQVYDWRFRHAPGLEECVGCHDPHSLEVRVDVCSNCHENVTDLESLKGIRTIASLGQDYDGDGDLLEGIAGEIEGLSAKLFTAIQTYTSEQGLGALCYSSTAYPYWFVDTNANGTCEDDEANYGNRWQQWTSRLLKATYNYQVANKDPGGYAHNAKYIIQLLHDSISDLNGSLSTPVDMANAIRNDSGHFNGAGRAARYWDQNETVSASCSKCHSGSEGFRFYLEHGVGIGVEEPDNGLDCATCHETFGNTWDVVTVDEVEYPGGITIENPGQVSNICGTCHSGRTGKADIDQQIASGNYRFLNVHYLPASGVKEGTNAKVGYEYDNKTYAGEWPFHGRCQNCHDPVATNHTFLPQDNPDCTNGCHAPTPIAEIRTQHTLDYDGDGSNTETLGDEIQGFASDLLAQMNAVGGLCYDANSYPYFFTDNNSSGGACDAGEAIYPNSFKGWTPALMKAAHNYQISQKDPGAWAHNFDYVTQLLFDSIEDLGGDVTGKIRP